MDLLIDVQKRVTFGKDSFRTFSLYDLCNNKQGQPTLSEENDPTQIVKKSLGQAVMVDKTLYISGQLGMGKDGNIVGGGTLAQVCQDFLLIWSFTCWVSRERERDILDLYSILIILCLLLIIVFEQSYSKPKI